jgi:hypothetical protein
MIVKVRPTAANQTKMIIPAAKASTRFAGVTAPPRSP